MLFRPSAMAPVLAELASRRIYVGTISWKFSGWCGILYDEDRYLWGRHFSEARFERECLREYAAVFKSVTVDATYYRLPREDFLQKLDEQTPEDFRFTLKVSDKVTIKNYPDLKQFGEMRGQANPLFLKSGLFKLGFLRHLEVIRPKVGMLLFEFSHFHPRDFAQGRDFIAALDAFFDEAPEGWQYGVEVRNRNFLHPEYFEMLRRHGVAHVYNQWTQMPPVTEQLGQLPVGDNSFAAARYLLTPGVSHDHAEEMLAPYNRLREIDPAARESFRSILQHLLAQERGESSAPAWLYVGNQLEGNALHTLADLLEDVV